MQADRSVAEGGSGSVPAGQGVGVGVGADEIITLDVALLGPGTSPSIHAESPEKNNV